MKVHSNHSGFCLLIILMAVMLLIEAGAPEGQVGAEQPGAPAKVEQPSWPPGYFSVPFYWNLSRKEVRDAISLKDEQIQKLKDLSQKFYEASKPRYGTQDWVKMSAEERKKKMEGITAENKQHTEQARKDIDALLTRDQLEKLRAIELRQQAAQLLWSYGPLSEKLSLTAQQKDQFAKNREELRKKVGELQKQIQNLYDQAGQTTMDMFTAEQREKLWELRMKGFGK